jgi:hypothetical protein
VTRSDNGLFFPYEFLSDANKAARSGYPELEPHFEQRRQAFSAILDLVGSYRQPLRLIGPDPAPEPRWAQNWFPPLDAAVAYTLTRHHRPATIIEVGGGHSSRFFARAARDHGLKPHHVVIDPGARAKEKITGLPVSHVPQPLEAADLAIFSKLKASDIVSLDGSHKLLPGSDVDVLIGRVLPRLPVGVLVHIHDCFLPDGYPPQWDNRVYNEQSAFLALVLASRDWPCVFASHYVSTRMASDVARSFIGGVAAQSEATPTSLWFTKANA